MHRRVTSIFDELAIGSLISCSGVGGRSGCSTGSGTVGAVL